MIAGKSVWLEYDAAGDRVGVYLDGTPIHCQRTKWPGWYEFHPTTTIYDPET